jgi:hypothetical protein
LCYLTLYQLVCLSYPLVNLELRYLLSHTQHSFWNTSIIHLKPNQFLNQTRRFCVATTNIIQLSQCNITFQPYLQTWLDLCRDSFWLVCCVYSFWLYCLINALGLQRFKYNSIWLRSSIINVIKWLVTTASLCLLRLIRMSGRCVLLVSINLALFIQVILDWGQSDNRLGPSTNLRHFTCRPTFLYWSLFLLF